MTEARSRFTDGILSAGMGPLPGAYSVDSSSCTAVCDAIFFLAKGVHLVTRGLIVMDIDRKKLALPHGV